MDLLTDTILLYIFALLKWIQKERGPFSLSFAFAITSSHTSFSLCSVSLSTKKPSFSISSSFSMYLKSKAESFSFSKFMASVILSRLSSTRLPPSKTIRFSISLWFFCIRSLSLSITVSSPALETPNLSLSAFCFSRFCISLAMVSF